MLIRGLAYRPARETDSTLPVSKTMLIKVKNIPCGSDISEIFFSSKSWAPGEGVAGPQRQPHSLMRRTPASMLRLAPPEQVAPRVPPRGPSKPARDRV
jgi:hypothetical protein